MPLAQHTSHVAAATGVCLFAPGSASPAAPERVQSTSPHPFRDPPAPTCSLFGKLPACDAGMPALTVVPQRQLPAPTSGSCTATIRGTVPEAYPFSSFARRSEISSTAYSSTEQQMPQVRAEGKTRHHSSKGTVFKCGHARAEFSSGRLFPLP